MDGWMDRQKESQHKVDNFGLLEVKKTVCDLEFNLGFGERAKCLTCRPHVKNIPLFVTAFFS